MRTDSNGEKLCNIINNPRILKNWLIAIIVWKILLN